MALTAIILAAGQGTRMKSDLPKVLHRIGGRPMLQHVIDSARESNAANIVIVYGNGGDQVRDNIRDPDLQWVLQQQQLGTAHAVAQALPLIDPDDEVVVLYGDTPLLTSSTIKKLHSVQQDSQSLVVLTFCPPCPTGYGRIVRGDDGGVEKIVEQKDANDEQLKINEVNSGVMLALSRDLDSWIKTIDSNNAQKEFYLTDCVEIARQLQSTVCAVQCDQYQEVLGVNDRVQLAQVEKYYQQRERVRLMQAGVTLLDPETIYIQGHVAAGRDVVIEPGVQLKGTVRIGDRVRVESHCVLIDTHVEKDTVIHSMSHIENAQIGQHCEIGPFARLRPDADLKADVKIGNFVEVKKSTIERGSKVNHLSYIGDCSMGADVNIGAGTIVCNYDGAHKHRTVIEDNVFIGSDTQLVAPVKIGKGATIGAGSTITKDVPEQKLTLSRSKQISIEGWQRPKKDNH